MPGHSARAWLRAGPRPGYPGWLPLLGSPWLAGPESAPCLALLMLRAVLAAQDPGDPTLGPLLSPEFLWFVGVCLGQDWGQPFSPQPGTLGARKFRVGRVWAGARGTYSFIVCRLCRFPLRVRYMPRSISVGPPTLGPPDGLQGAPRAPVPDPTSRAAGSNGAGLQPCSSLESQPDDWTPRHRPDWDSDGRSQEMGGTRMRSREKKYPSRPTLRGSP